MLGTPALGARPATAIFAMATLALVLACGQEGAPSPTPAPSPEFGSCNPGGEAIQVLSGQRHQKYARPVREALGIAMAYTAQKYGWRPTYPVCVHFFNSQTDFASGLEQLAGLSAGEAARRSKFWGTTGIDTANGLDAIYINAGIVNEPTLMGRLAAHEYFHVLQSHLPTIAAPAWFLEGLAEWEMMSLLGFRYENWFILLQDDVRRGRDVPLADLEGWDQWQTVNSAESQAFTGPYWKAAAAIMFIEATGGPDAPVAMLRGAQDAVPAPVPFSTALLQVTGITLDEFDDRLREFISQHKWVAPTSTPWSGFNPDNP